jgi:oligopeptide/dipeptide ABC transporter ATP-binding protein
MYLGRIVESGRSEDIWREPAHPYTRALLSSAPVADPKVVRRRSKHVLQGELPSPLNPPQGCAFNTRCPLVQERCRRERPVLRALPGGRQVACHFDLLAQRVAASNSVSTPLHTTA